MEKFMRKVKGENLWWILSTWITSSQGKRSFLWPGIEVLRFLSRLRNGEWIESRWINLKTSCLGSPVTNSGMVVAIYKAMQKVMEERKVCSSTLMTMSV